MNKSLIIFALFNLSFYSSGMSPIPDFSLLFSTVSSSRNMKTDNQDANSKIIDLVNAHASLSPIQRKSIFDFVNQLSDRDYIKLLNKVIDTFHENSSFSEKQMELLLFPELLEIPESLGNKDLFLVFNYKNRNIQLLKNRILESEKISKSLKEKICSCLSYKAKLSAYETVGFKQGIIPEILPVSEWESKFLTKSLPREQQQKIITNLSEKLKKVVGFLIKLNSKEDISSSDIKDLSFLYQQMLPSLESCLQLSPPSSTEETRLLEDFFSEKTFPLLKKLQSERFSILQRYPNNPVLNDLQNQYNRIGCTYDSYLIDAGIIRMLKQRDEIIENKSN